MRVRLTIGRELVRMNNGRFLVGLLQWPLTVAMALKIFGLPEWTYWAFVPVSFVLTWFLGWAYEALGVRKYYELKASEYWLKEVRR